MVNATRPSPAFIKEHVEASILKAFDIEPDMAFTSQDLVDIAFPNDWIVGDSHYDAVRNVAKNMVSEGGWFDSRRGGGVYERYVFFNRYSVLSYALARLRTHPVLYGRSPEELRLRLQPGGEDHHLVVEGGEYWRNVHKLIAQRDGNKELAKRLKAEEEAAKPVKPEASTAKKAPKSLMAGTTSAVH